MKNTFSLVVAFFVVTLFQDAVSGREVRLPDPSAPSVEVTFHMIRVPVATGVAITANPKLKTDPAATLAQLNSLAAEKKAVVVANPTFRVELGTRGFFDGPGDPPDPSLEAEVFLKKDLSLTIHYVVRHLKQRLINSTDLPRGSTQYLGRMDSPNPTEMLLVFLNAR
jgi:hypothetical protein